MKKIRMENIKLTKFSNEWSLQERVAFVHGYAFAQAEMIKKSGSFKDLSINEIIKIILEEAIKC